MHEDAALLTDGSVDSGWAAGMCVCVGAGGGVVSGRQWRVLESVEHIDAALLPDGAVLVLDAAAMSADDSGECWSRWSK